MKRILSLIIIGLLCFSALSVSTPQIKASGATSYPWSMFRHDPEHTGFSPSLAPNTNNILWTFEIGGRILSSPAVADGMVFVGSMDNNKTYALGQSSGVLLWSSQLDESIWGSPAVENGKVFINDLSNLYALDEGTGDVIWRYSSAHDGLICSSPVVKDGMVFVGSDFGSKGVFALNEETGSQVWSYSGIRVASTPAISDGKVFVASFAQNAKVCALDEFTGELIWSVDVSAFSDGSFFSSPAVSDGMVFLGLTSVESETGTILALNENDGKIAWSRQIGQIFSSPAVRYGKVFIGCYDHNVYAFDESNGNLAWTYTTGDSIELSSPAVADSKVFVGSDDCNVYALDATTGTKIWNYKTGRGVWSSPAVSDGAVYVGSMDGKVYAFSARVRTWTVDDDGPADFHTIQEAINSANEGDTIYVRIGRYYENLVVNKTLSLVGESRETTIIDGGGVGNAAEVIVNNVTITGFTVRNGTKDFVTSGIRGRSIKNCKISGNHIENNDFGIFLEDSSDNVVFGNDITHNRIVGIEVSHSSNNTLAENNITENAFGIELSSSSDNSLKDNKVLKNWNDGISLFGSWNNTLRNNSMLSNRQNFDVGAHCYPNDIDVSNTVDGKPIYYWVYAQDQTVPSNAGYVALINSTNITVKDLTLKNNGEGIWLSFTKNSTIANNNITNNREGIVLENSSNNTLRNNNITENWYRGVELIGSSDNKLTGNKLTVVDLQSSSNNAIVGNNMTAWTVTTLRESSNNTICHNNFIADYELLSPRVYVYGESYNNVWDDGFPSGGNYWSDYTERYPDAEELDGSGIWGTPYVIDPYNRDRYPLMNPWKPIPPSVPKFLALPFGDTDIRVQQGWIYTWNPDPSAHQGIDYKKGDWESFDVVAAANGRAMWSEQYYPDGSGYGRFVLIWHEEKDPESNNYFTLYAHLDSIAHGIPYKNRYDTNYLSWKLVKKGEVIGRAGNTGAPSVGIHLHFEVQRKAYAHFRTDPYDLYKTREYYPNAWLYPPETSKYTRCGTNHLWTTDPPTFALNEPPIADAGLDQSISSGDFVQFDGSNSYDPDGTIVNYRWNFGDGTTAEGKIVTHRFRGAQNEPKTYTVTLTAEDNYGAIATDAVFVTVKPLRKLVDVGRGYFGVSCWMEATYNWVGTDEATGENLYIISKIETYSGGISGAYQLFILRRTSPPPSIPELVWYIPLPTAPILRTYVTPFTPSIWQELWGEPAEITTLAFQEGTFQGIGVTDTSLMVIVATGTETGITLYYDAGITKFDSGSPATHLKLEELKELWELRDIIDLLNKIIGIIGSPCELRIYDLEGRVTGLVNGEKKERVPGSAYANGTILMLCPNKTYRYEVVGIDKGTYRLLIISVENGEATTFNAIDIPTSANAIHQYSIDWDALSRGEKGVTVQIDNNGDGTFEKTFTAGSGLTRDEFLLQVPIAEAFPMWIAGIVAVALIAIVGAATAVFWRKRKQQRPTTG